MGRLRVTRDFRLYDPELASAVQRGERNSNARLTAAQAREIRSRANGGESTYTLAEEFGVSQPQVCRIKNGQRWGDALEGSE